MAPFWGFHWIGREIINPVRAGADNADQIGDICQSPQIGGCAVIGIPYLYAELILKR